MSKERWKQLGISEQMVNIGGELERAVAWKNKNDTEKMNYFFKYSVGMDGINYSGFEEPRAYRGTRSCSGRIRRLLLRKSLEDYR